MQHFLEDRFLENKVAIVTGGSKGIGRAIAGALLEAGASVAIGARHGLEVERAAQEMNAANQGPGRAAGFALDVGDASDVTKFFGLVDTEFGGIDVLVNNAGMGIFRPTADLSVEEWDRVIRTNLNGVFYASREALSRFRKRNAGYIINISSLAGKNPFAGGAAYNGAKFGVNGFSEAMMLDHRQENVRVSYIMPGSVDTDFSPRGTSAAGWKIAPRDVAEITLMLLRMPARTLISRVEVRPAKPVK